MSLIDIIESKVIDNKDDPIAAFGSAEEGEDPLFPYIDPQAFERVGVAAQKEQLTAIFDTITLAGVDYYLEVQETVGGKQYHLTKDDKVITTQVMDSQFKDTILDALETHQQS